ncbi:MAG: hypothetical protein K8V42_04010 [Enterococcus aquimarinus]|uniref:Uncharacterized protein n=1 Tax=Enterococcus aquimarinus TaxID=328396 RepID=A0A9E3ZTU4_9ENTE|nr:hypothetical protein [Enterococcus aquimarinus]
MEINLFQGHVDNELDKMYTQLSGDEKLIVELYGLLAINKPGEKQDFEISQEVLIDKETNKIKARYIVDIPLRFTNK